MNDLLQKLGGAKKLFIIAGGVVICFFIALTYVSYQQESLGLSGSVTTASAPAMYGVVDMAENQNGGSFGALRANKMALVATDRPEMAPAVPPSDGMRRMPNPSTPSGDTKIIKTADLSLYVKNVTEAAHAIDDIRIALGGQQGGAYFTEYQPGMRTGDMTIWVPSARFDDALSGLRRIALQVREERITATDVSAQFVDLTARIKNLRATEAQLTEIMKRSGTVADILNVSRELSSTRSEIEQLQGSLDHLNTQVAYSSIHITLTQEAKPSVVTNEWSPLSVLKNALKGTLIDLTRFADMLIIFIARLPYLILSLGFWVLILLGLWKLGCFLYKKLRASTV